MNYAFVAMWQDLPTFQTFIVVANGKVSKVKNFWVNILTTKSKWVVNMFLKLFFFNLRFEKHFSSFTLPITMATNSSFSFSHLNNWWEINWLLDKVVEIFVHGLQSIRSFMVAWQLLNNLKKIDCCTNNVSSNKGGIYNCFGPMICFQNSNVLSKLKIVLKICV